MQYIDKYILHPKGQVVNMRFLQQCWNDDENCMYPDIANANALYEEYKKAVFRDQWLPLLLEEQHGRCCYCMRRLDERGLNVEHVVPRSAKGVEGHREYGKYAAAPAIHDHVALAEDMPSINRKEDIATLDKMPHSIAHSNLLASCKGVTGIEKEGVCCCNQARGDSFLTPLMLMKDGPDKFVYSKNGIMYLITEDNSWDMVLKKLNGDTFQQIRSIWFHLSRTDYTVEQIMRMSNIAERIRLFKNAYNINNFESLDIEIQKYSGIESNTYWDILMSFDWFYGFYKHRTI